MINVTFGSCAISMRWPVMGHSVRARGGSMRAISQPALFDADQGTRGHARSDLLEEALDRSL